MNLFYDRIIDEEEKSIIEEDIADFFGLVQAKENTIYIMKDKCTDAIFCECHINAVLASGEFSQ